MTEDPGVLILPTFTQFEAIRHFEENGEEYWTARELMPLLGYKSWQKFENVIDEAIAVCAKEGDDVAERNFIRSEKVSGSRGPKQKDYRLTRHACYLIAMSADGNKPEVALAKIYFAVAVEQMELLTALEEELMRLEARPELLRQNKELAVLARRAGVITDLEFAAFWNAGYLGLYQEVAKQIRARKGIRNTQDIGDYSNSDEIAANIFKASLTRQLMQQRGIATRDGAMATHFEAGRIVRNSLVEAGLPTPEYLITPSKSYQQLVKEQKTRLRLKLEDVVSLWAQLEERREPPE
jgi:DNA-damage-inducible protein D